MINAFYFKNINSTGGVESFFYYLSKLYKNMVVYYKEAHPEQIKRLAKNVEVHKYKENEIIKCDNFFCCYNPDIIDNVIANNYIHLIHCDYKQVNFKPIMHPKFTKYIAVSKLAGESFKEITGVDYELIYNPVAIDIPKVEKYNDDKLHLVSATRLTKEKGLKRMQKLASMLDKAGINYEWLVYTNRHREAIGWDVVYKESKLDIIDEIAKADFLVQLSDCEAFCYSVIEALSVNTPVICTDLPVFKELGVNEGNSIICNLQMSNVDLNKLKQPFKFKYEPPKSNWDKYLDNKSSYNPNDYAKIRVKRGYTDIVNNKYYPKNNEIIENEITKQRASYLEAKGLIEWLY